MRKISRPVSDRLRGMARMRSCALFGLSHLYGQCGGRIWNPEWHHVWTFAGQQIDEPWAIVAGCTRHHEMVKKDKRVRAAFEVISLALATPEDLAAYPRKDWKAASRQAAATLGDERVQIVHILGLKDGYGDIRTASDGKGRGRRVRAE